MKFSALGFYKIKAVYSLKLQRTVLVAFNLNYWLSVATLGAKHALFSRNYITTTPKFFLNNSSTVSEYFKIQECFTLAAVTLSFTGKGYRLVANNKSTLAFSYGHSHTYYIYNPQVNFFFRTKTRGFFIGLTDFILRGGLRRLFWAKPINIYTGRGVRARKQIIRRKVGKISLYM